MVRGDGGRLFQTSGSQTANARRPCSSVRVRRITAAQVEVERRDRRCGSDAQKATIKVGNVRRTPLRYDWVHEDCEFELDAVLHLSLIHI